MRVVSGGTAGHDARAPFPGFRGEAGALPRPRQWIAPQPRGERRPRVRRRAARSSRPPAHSAARPGEQLVAGSRPVTGTTSSRDASSRVARAPAAPILVGRVHHDPVEPRAERRVTAEGVDLPHHGPERVLDDVLGVLVITGDPAGEAKGTPPVPRHQLIGRRRISAAERVQQIVVAVDAPAAVHHVNVHALEIRASPAPDRRDGVGPESR